MGRKKVFKSADRTQMQTSARMEMTGVLKQLENYHPYLRELVILGQHLWVTADKWILTADNLKDEAGALDRLSDLAALRQFHTDMIMAENELEMLQRKTFELRKKLRNFADPLEAMGEFIERILPTVMDMQLRVAEKTRSLKVIDDKYHLAIKAISVQLAGSLHDMMSNLEEHITTLKNYANGQLSIPAGALDDAFEDEADGTAENLPTVGNEDSVEQGTVDELSATPDAGSTEKADTDLAAVATAVGSPTNPIATA